jgi:hypothetical protein
MSQSYYERRLHCWLEEFDHSIRIAEPAPFTARAGTGLDLPGPSKAPRAPSDLLRHVDERHQLKDVKFHPYLLDIILGQLDNAMPIIPEGSRIDERHQGFYEEVHKPYKSDNEAQLQAKAQGPLSAACKVASIISFLLAEESEVPFHPLQAGPSALTSNIPDHEVAFLTEYCEMEPFDESGIESDPFDESSLEFRPLHPDTIDRIKRFAAVTSYLK